MSVLMPICAGVWLVPDSTSGRWNTSSIFIDVVPHWEINRQLLGSFYFSPGSQWRRAKLGQGWGVPRMVRWDIFSSRRIAQRENNWTKRLGKDKTASRVGIWKNIPEKSDHRYQRLGVRGSLVCFKNSYSEKVVLFECSEQVIHRVLDTCPPPLRAPHVLYEACSRVLNKRIMWSELHKENDLWSRDLAQWLEQVVAFQGPGFDSSTTE